MKHANHTKNMTPTLKIPVEIGGAIFEAQMVRLDRINKMNRIKNNSENSVHSVENSLLDLSGEVAVCLVGAAVLVLWLLI